MLVEIIVEILTFLYCVGIMALCSIGLGVVFATLHIAVKSIKKAWRKKHNKFL